MTMDNRGRVRRRPYERYAARTMSRLALRRLALQSIGRPDVAQGPLHDALLEMFPRMYSEWIHKAESEAKSRTWKMVVVLNPHGLRYGDHPQLFPYDLFYTRLHEPKFMAEGSWATPLGNPRIITYITRAGDRLE